jgi:hypothetical protein
MTHLRYQKDGSQAITSLNIRLGVMPTPEEQERITREVTAIVEVWSVFFDERAQSFRVSFSGSSNVEEMQSRVERIINPTTTKSGV